MRDRLLNLLATIVWRHAWLIVVVATALAIVCAMYAWSSLRLNANLDDLIAPDRPYMTQYRAFLREFGDLEHIIVAIDASADRAAAESAADALLTKLRAISDLPGVYGSIEPDEQLRIATRAMSDDELRDFAAASAAFPVLLNADLTRVIGEANDLLSQLIAAGLTTPAQQQREIGAAAVMLLKAVAASQPDSESWRELAMLVDTPQRQYLQSDTARYLFINILPVKDYSTLSVIEKPLREIGAAIDEVRREFPIVPIGLTGKPVLQYDEMATSNADMTRASIIALLLCSILFMIMMQGWRRPLLAVIAFGIGSAWTYGFATLTIGQLNLLSIVFMLVLVGVGLDYGVHVIARYQEFLRKRYDTRAALTHATRTAVRGNITGALTSSIVFFMALFTSFQGLRELGLIAGGGLILCLVAMCLALPALLAIVERHRPATAAETATVIGDEDKAVADNVDAWFIRHARLIVTIVGIVTLGLILVPGSVRFEFNLLKLQAQGLESIEWEHRIIADSSSASWFGAAIAPNQAEALHIIQRASDKASIGAIHSVFDIVQPDSPQRDHWRDQIRNPHSPGHAGGSPPEDLNATLTQTTERLQIIAPAAAAQVPDEAQSLAQLISDLKAINLNDPQQTESITATFRAIARNMKIILGGNALPLREALPAALRDQFLSRDGRYLVMLHPARDVWEYQPMQDFVADLRDVDPNVTGVPITHFESLGEMRRAFIIMSLLALGAIIVLLAIDFRSLVDVALALAPLIIGMIWTVEIMGLFGVSFNLANFFAAPMLIGLGVDAAVHILHRFHEGGHEGGDRLKLGHTRRAVILTSLTTIIGFGALIIAHHRGLRSLGLVMAIGSTACMLSSIIVLPALLAWRGGKQETKSRKQKA
jgi:hopanoid biosynthesis associated RND transporter like protein HpnN